MTTKLQVNCPRCQSAVKWSSESPFRPFCSERCQWIDLGRWLTEDYRIPGENDANDVPEQES